MKIGIVKNGYYSSPSQEEQIKRIKDECEKRGCETVVYKNARPVFSDTEFDFTKAFFLDKDVFLAKEAENRGIVLLNSANATELADDKCKTYLALAKGNVKQQETCIIPKKYNYFLDENYLKEVAERLGYPLVAKKGCGSFGEQVYLVKNYNELIEADKKIGIESGLYQKFRAHSKGKSLRIIVVGGKAIGGIRLENDRDFRSNAHLGGVGTIAELRPEFVSEAEKAAKLLNLNYCGVDLFCDEPVVIEVNSNALFNEFERKTGINVAGKIVEELLSL